MAKAGGFNLMIDIN